MKRGEPVIVANGMVFGYGSGEETKQSWPDIGLQFDSTIRAAKGTHATIYVLDAQTGKELWSSGDQMHQWNHFTGITVVERPRLPGHLRRHVVLLRAVPLRGQPPMSQGPAGAGVEHRTGGGSTGDSSPAWGAGKRALFLIESLSQGGRGASPSAVHTPPEDQMQKQRLFVASCVSLVTTSMVFAIRGDVAGPMSSAFQITNEQMGLIFSPAFWAFTISIFISGALVDMVGMRALHVLSAIGYFLGVGLVLVAPHPTAPVASIFSETGTTLLYAGFFVMGLSQGLVEGVINPLVATIYSDQKTKRLNMLHAWWPGGQVIGGLLAVAMSGFGASWQLKLVTISIPAAVYLFMAFPLDYPQTERVPVERLHR